MINWPILVCILLSIFVGIVLVYAAVTLRYEVTKDIEAEIKRLNLHIEECSKWLKQHNEMKKRIES